ncbi:GNAT family N-acetyltransferase [Deinococcus metallilatus]|uniref:GNAT family N-acetyltransferase n=2 Tax=Deinococcus TaxID=1298 RepID=A0AAJ5F4Q6_9DEIO|nr:GNAT family N-acetyltransferase [Deinococcus metallilatus]MBB5294593.1 GNAT superfamily N-acetyltransferase [Deinococcus metallilatus]QBY07634.1 GNAT family N-acetyltransferase [Deinococcus metallilatus]RXJ14050.1 GNAT family N-acetyltransferase [Deinococcus metallilatus]TLK30015.1 GNAT family N-acetyltransferase [Deinococcus metallilatus]GMA15807.1 N-acetyltransferase [Deinococcus metallilatus]
MNVTPLALHHAPLLHTLYAAAPGYFALLGTRVPSLSEVERDVEIALLDPRRRLKLLFDDAGDLIGSLDCKHDYPGPGDLTINLLLIREDRQSQGLGKQAVRDLEAHVPPGTARILASVLGDNPRGARFWERLGYTFALDARPVMTWYAKPLTAPPLPAGGNTLTVASD